MAPGGVFFYWSGGGLRSARILLVGLGVLMAIAWLRPPRPQGRLDGARLLPIFPTNSGSELLIHLVHIEVGMTQMGAGFAASKGAPRIHTLPLMLVEQTLQIPTLHPQTISERMHRQLQTNRTSWFLSLTRHHGIYNGKTIQSLRSIVHLSLLERAHYSNALPSTPT